MKRTIMKADVLLKLRQLRMGIEAEMAEDGIPGQLDEAQATLLTDVCQKAFGLNDADTYYVVGDAFLVLTDRRYVWPVLEDPVEATRIEQADA